ncbi:hypothetical protein [Tautonia sociabilis]|uniref:Uncharacterized protein n=1 Tax=Tautonia sociabilis TaxID=2080755 RepID=A0A432MD36_9BACT|nr:hypothetical protein [Tautonia sociabilis]RUL81770.1 hypothetical protein TsocGM_24570 [Tautonia sociabilis]
MSKRISLVESLKRDQEEIDPVVEQNFLKYGKLTPPPAATGEPQAAVPAPAPAPAEAASVEPEPVRRPRPSKVAPVGLIPVTVRLRPEIAGALKRASLERQLSGEELYTQQDIVEQALEPWLRAEGYLS